MRHTWVLVGTLLFARLTVASPEGACSKKDLEAMKKALAADIPADMRAPLTMRGLTEACEPAMPAGLVKGIFALQSVDPSMRATIAAAILDENRAWAKAACADFDKVFPDVAKVAPADKSAILYKGCRYEKLGIATDKEYAQAAKSDFALAMLAPPFYQWLVDNKMDKGSARSWARAILGLSK